MLHKNKSMDARGDILFTGESPVAQWLEHLTRSRRVVGSNPIWISNFSEFSLHLITCCCCFIFNILTLEVGWLHLDLLKFDSASCCLLLILESSILNLPLLVMATGGWQAAS